MVEISETERLLRVWEFAWNRAPCEQAIALADFGLPETNRSTILAMPIGYRDKLLAQLRVRLFGSTVNLLAQCPACEERSELDFELDTSDWETPESKVSEIKLEGKSYHFRIPNSSDLIAMKNASTEDPRAFLVASCLDESQDSNLQGEVVDAISRAMGELDPNANLTIDVACSFCDHCWVQPFDVVALVWEEVSSWAKRTISDVHALAKAYGWSEREILEMTPSRRQIYLNMAEA